MAILPAPSPARGEVPRRRFLECFYEPWYKMPFIRREPNFGVTSVNYDFAELLELAGGHS